MNTKKHLVISFDSKGQAVRNYYDVDKMQMVNAAISVTDEKELITKKGKEIEETLDKKTWNIRQWEINDPEGLRRIYNNFPATYRKLYNEYYKPKSNK